jgi:hypothetical protein
MRQQFNQQLTVSDEQADGSAPGAAGQDFSLKPGQTIRIKLSPVSSDVSRWWVCLCVPVLMAAAHYVPVMTSRPAEACSAC